VNEATTIQSDSTEPDFNAAIVESSWQMEEAVTSEPVVPPFSLSEPEPAEQSLPGESVAAAAVMLHEPDNKSIPELNDWIPAETLPDQSQSPRVPPFFYEPEPEVKPVSTQFPDLVSSILTPAPTPAPVVKSIAMQINDILQGMIAETSFERRGLTVNDGPDHGVIVTLDGQQFSGVKEVSDEEVRGLIRSAVLEWEKQSKRGGK
jgi:hypothetical protein